MERSSSTRVVDFAPTRTIYGAFEVLPVLDICPCGALPKTTLNSDARLRDVAQPIDADRRSQKEARHGSRYSQVFQFPEGLRLHSADRRRQGRVCPYFRGR